MTSVFFLVPIALLLLCVAVAAFVWAVRNDQFDDLDTPASRILFDDDARPPVSPAEKSPAPRSQ